MLIRLYVDVRYHLMKKMRAHIQVCIFLIDELCTMRAFVHSLLDRLANSVPLYGEVLWQSVLSELVIVIYTKYHQMLRLRKPIVSTKFLGHYQQHY